MPSFGDHSRRAVTLEENRLETPSMSGFRRGMSSSGMIGRRLGSMYEVDSDLPHEMHSALRALHSRFVRR